MVVEQDQTLLDGDNDDEDDMDDYDEDDDAILEEHNSTIIHDDEASLDFPHAMPIQDHTEKMVNPQRNHVCGVR